MTTAEMEHAVVEIQWELEKLMIALGPIRQELGKRLNKEYRARNEKGIQERLTL